MNIRTALFAAATAAVVGILAGCSTQMPTTHPMPSASTSTSAASPTPTKSPTPTREPLARQEYSGYGDVVQDIPKTTEIAVVTFSCGNCESNTTVKSNGREGLLVNVIGPYSGSHFINLYDDSATSRFEIETKGDWSLVIEDARSAQQFDGAASGYGDQAIIMMDAFTSAQIENDGPHNFVVRAYGTGQSPLIVNEIGAYSGSKALEGPSFVQVESSGSWSITPR